MLEVKRNTKDRTLHHCRAVPSGHVRRVLCDLLGMSEPKQCCRRRHLPHNVVGAINRPRAWILTEAHDNHYGPEGVTQGQISRVIQGAFTLVHHAACQDGVRCDDLLTMLGRGIARG